MGLVVKDVIMKQNIHSDTKSKTDSTNHMTQQQYYRGGKREDSQSERSLEQCEYSNRLTEPAKIKQPKIRPQTGLKKEPLI